MSPGPRARFYGRARPSTGIGWRCLVEGSPPPGRDLGGAHVFMERSAVMKIAGSLAVAMPAVVMRLGGIHAPPIVEVLVFGSAVVATAFLHAWAAEAAQLDISGGLAIAILALIAVLPEYAVDLYFSYTAGTNPDHAQYAAANMTGSNRLLIGFGWPLVAFVA